MALIDYTLRKHGQDTVKTFKRHSLSPGKFISGTLSEGTILNTERALCIRMLAIGLHTFKMAKQTLVMDIFVR